jgi:hypothetical protein
MVIRRVAPLSCAKIAALMYMLIGLVIGAVFSLVALAGSAFGGGENAGLGAIFGIGAVILLPIFYGCLGFVMTAVMALLYNLFAGIVGGVNVEVQ